MAVKSLKRSIIQRIAGIAATSLPWDRGAWTYDGESLVVNLERVRELARTGAAVRIEGRGLPDRVLLVNGEDGRFHAFSNRCGHMGRRIDPVPGTDTVQCCSLMKATYGYNGEKIAGPGRGAVKTYAIDAFDGKLIITI